MASPPIHTTLVIEQGTTWTRRWRITDPATSTPRDLTEWTARAQIRAQIADSTPLFEFAGDGITCDSDGYVTLTVTPVQSSAWTWRDGVFDVELVDPTGRVTRISQGAVRVSAEVTR